MKLLDRYILKAHAGPLFFGFFTIMFVFILSFLTRFIDRLVGKGLDVRVMVEMVLLESAWMVSLALPMSVLIATVMAFGSLTNNSEMTVMRSGGISVYRLVAPVIAVSMLLAFCSERFNNVLLPEANYRANALLSDITRLKPGFALEQGAFSNVIQGFSIMVRKVDSKSGALEEIIMYDRERPSLRTVVTARKGRIAFTPDYRFLIMHLDDGQIHELALPGMDRYRRIAFGRHRYVFAASGYGFERSDERNGKRGGRELSADELWIQGASLKSSVDSCARALQRGPSGLGQDAGVSARNPERQVADTTSGTVGGAAGHDTVAAQSPLEALRLLQEQYVTTMIEYHKKYSLAVACVVFAFVGAPLGVMARRGGLGVGAALSLLFFVMYWALMIGGEKIARQAMVAPAVAVWAPDVLIGAAGMFMLYRLNHSISGSTR